MDHFKTIDLDNEFCAHCRGFTCNFITRCDHFFHRSCLLNSMKKSQKCPKCAKVITTNSLYEKFLAGYEIKMKDIHNESLDDLVDFIHLSADSKVKIDENIYRIAFDHSLSLNRDLTLLGHDKISLLHKAAKSGHLFIVNLCLPYSEEFFNENYSPVFAACEENYPDIVNLLLTSGAVFDKADPKTGYSFAHYVAMSGNLELINKALEMKVNFLVKNKEDITPLHLACQRGHLEAAKKLIELGLDVKALSSEGYSMLHAACVGGNFELFKFMIDLGLDIHATYRNGISSVHGAVYGGNDDILSYLMEQKVDYSIALFSPLHVAAKLNNLQMIKKLLDLGFDINSVDCDGNTPLHYACTFQFNDLANYLLDCDADFNLLNAKGESAVQIAYYDEQNDDIIFHPRLRNLILIWALRGANVEVLYKLEALGDKRACILLHFPREYSDIIQPLLLNSDVDLNTTLLDSEGNNLFLLACKLNLDLAISSCISNELDASVTNNNGDTPLHLTCANHEFYLASKICALPNAVLPEKALNTKGKTPLNYAIEGNCLNDLIPILIENYIHVADNDGNTPLHLVFSKGQYWHFDELKNDIHIDYDVKNNEGKTALHLAAENGYLYSVKFLIEKGVDPNVLDSNNNLAIDLARINNHNETVEFLKSFN